MRFLHTKLARLRTTACGGKNGQAAGWAPSIAGVAIAAWLGLVGAEPLRAAQGAMDAAARRAAEARVLAEYPADEDYFPASNYLAYPPELRALIRRADMLADTCRGSGENQEVHRACNDADATLTEIESKGWCWGGAERERERHWLACARQASYRPREEPRTPIFEEADIAGLPWQVAETAQSCGARKRAEAFSCAAAALESEQRLMDGAYRKLASLMAASARLRLETEQDEWLRSLEARATECAAELAEPGAEREVAVLRCRAGLTIARHGQLQRLLPLPDEMRGPGGAAVTSKAGYVAPRGGPSRGLYNWGSVNPRFDRRRDFLIRTGVDLADATDDQQNDFRDWELRNSEAFARETIDQAQSAGGKAAAIALLYVRSVDKWRRAEEAAAIAERIRQRAEAVEKK
jgi:hypothetical protein